MDFGSQVYAPINRIGIYLDRGSEKYHVDSKYNSTMDGKSLIQWQ